MTLYELSDEFQSILNNLEEDGEPTEAVLAQLAEVEEAIRTKADGYVALIRHHQDIATAISAEHKRLGKRLATFTNKANWLTQRLHDAMNRMGETKITTATNTIKIVKNGGIQSVRIDVSLHDLPEPYQIKETVIKANNEAIRTDLQLGKHIPGCELMERGTHLRIS